MTTIRIGLRPWAVLRQRRRRSVRSVAAAVAKGFCSGLLAAGIVSRLAVAADVAAPLFDPRRPSPAFDTSALERAATPSTAATQSAATQRSKRANFELERASREARQLADWIVDSSDNRKLPFAIVDKTDAKVFVFHADGRLRGGAAALLGLAKGDDAVPGIGNRALSSIRPEERTTPAGRYVAALDRNLRGKEILWVDYDGAVSMHPVVTSKPEERRAQRLASPTPLDNRISYGCINVPAKFFENVVHPAFTGTDGIVYVLPETRSAREVFESYDVDERERLQHPVQAARTPAAPTATLCIACADAQ